MKFSLPGRRVRFSLVAIAGVLLLAVAVLAGLDVGRFRPTIERTLSERLERTVSIATMAREDRFSLHPVIALSGLRIGQPAWVKSAAPMATIRTARVTLPLLPLLIGRLNPETIELTGVEVDLRRDAAGRSNWQGDTPRRVPRSDREPGVGTLIIRDAHVRLTDAESDRSADVTLAASPTEGVRLAGTGRLRDAPVTLRAHMRPDGAFGAEVAGPALTARIDGRTARPFTLGRFTGTVAARGADLRYLDTVIEAGLPGTQPFDLTARVQHNRPDWTISALAGRIGRSAIEGQLTVRKRNGRSLIDGALHSTAFDPDDLSTNAQRAADAAQARAIGPRVIPDTRIALDHLRKTDGKLAFRIDRLLWRNPSPIERASGAFTLDHGVLTLAPLTLGLSRGTIEGMMKVVHPDGAARLSLALDLRESRLEAFARGGGLAGPLTGRARLTGTGGTIRAALANATGMVTLVAPGGTIGTRAAELIGQNVGRALKAGAEDTTALRCLVARFEGRGGRFTPAPVVLDTSVMRADAHGTIDLATERVALSLPGRSKVPAAFRLSGPLQIGGTLSRPAITATQATSAHGILTSLTRAIEGKKEAAAVNADCAGLAAAAMR